jgi:nucleoside diphosphate kinase
LKNTGVKSTDEICLIILRNELWRQRKTAEALMDLNSLENIEILQIKTMTPTRELIKAHYNKNETWLNKVGEKTISLLQANARPIEHDALGYGQLILESLINYNTEGLIVVIALRGPNACAQLRALVGDTDPEQAKPGTMRAKYASDSMRQAGLEIRAVRNAIHCSEDAFDGLMETRLFFPEFSLPDLITS